MWLVIYTPQKQNLVILLASKLIVFNKLQYYTTM